MMMRRETPKIPKLCLDLLLYTNMEPKHWPNIKVATRRWNLRINVNQQTQHRPLDGAQSNSPRMNITPGSSGETEDEAEEKNGGE